MSARSVSIGGLVSALAVELSEDAVDMAKRHLEYRLLKAVDPGFEPPKTWVEAARMPLDERIKWTEETDGLGVHLTARLEVDE